VKSLAARQYNLERLRAASSLDFRFDALTSTRPKKPIVLVSGIPSDESWPLF